MGFWIDLFNLDRNAATARNTRKQTYLMQEQMYLMQEQTYVMSLHPNQRQAYLWDKARKQAAEEARKKRLILIWSTVAVAILLAILLMVFVATIVSS